MPDTLFSSDEFGKFLTLLEESSRAHKEIERLFIEPADGVLRRVKSRRHHLVFGRRGSGKSSLLTKAKADLTIDRIPIAWVDLESFKGHSYPDLLISILIKTLQAFEKWLSTYAGASANRTIWSKMRRKPSRKPFNKKTLATLQAELSAKVIELEKELHTIEAAKIVEESGETTQDLSGKTLSLSAGYGGASAGAGVSRNQNRSSDSKRKEEFVRSKVDFLRRHVIEYQNLFDRIVDLADSEIYLILDDLYHIRREDQPKVVDYFHSIAKGHRLWLKIGTVRHRSVWYQHGNPPVGVKRGDDADDIDLDLTLERYKIASDFLEKVLDRLTQECGLEREEILTDGAFERLVLASGGVARDFLGILRRSVDVHRNNQTAATRSKITAEDVNVAAGEYDGAKQEEFRNEIYDDEIDGLRAVFEEIKKFCLDDVKCNCFLIEQGAQGKHINSIHELVDLKLLHKIKSRVSVKTKTQVGKLFEAYMLDLSQYAGARKRRDLEMIEFWKKDADERLRRAALIFRRD